MSLKATSLLVVFTFTLFVFTSADSLCPGASEEQYNAGGSSECVKPEWNFWYFDNQILLPSTDPTRFYQTSSAIVYEMRCPIGTCFSQVDQMCVHAREWKNPCKSVSV